MMSQREQILEGYTALILMAIGAGTVCYWIIAGAIVIFRG